MSSQVFVSLSQVKRIGQDPAAKKMENTSSTYSTKTIDGIKKSVCETRTHRLSNPTIYKLSNKEAPPGTVDAENEAKQGSILQGKYNIHGYFPALNTTLILVPGRLLSQWVGEFEKFLTPERFNKLRIAQITKLEELEFLRVGDIQNFDVVLMAYSVFFHSDYRARLRKLTGLGLLLENKCPRMNLLRHATGRFMKSTNSGDSSKAELKQELNALRAEFDRELSKADGGDAGAGAPPEGSAVAAKSKATNMSSKKRKAEEMEDEDKNGEEENQDDDAVALGENLKKGAVRQFWKAKLNVLDEEVNKWPSWWKRKVGTEVHSWSVKSEKAKFHIVHHRDWVDIDPQPAPGKYPRPYVWISQNQNYRFNPWNRYDASHPQAGVGPGRWHIDFFWANDLRKKHGVWQRKNFSRSEKYYPHLPQTKHFPLIHGKIPKKPLYQNFVFPVLEQVDNYRLSILSACEGLFSHASCTTTQCSGASVISFQNEKPDVRIVLFQMFFRRVVFDEFHESDGFGNKEVHGLVNLKALSKWGLTGTPHQKDTRAVVAAASLFGVDLAGRYIIYGPNFC